ncbi:hypothetical protein J2T12_002940 [Paenibacillus anaericanus]|uniref:hypothetical protein n=1 Tax=Paenibacillus anaericanus TaxID=170367 RepID=UPI002788C2A0|nr:hypothetical protein [Paenibacillus anaericanus]MDQ0089528.1 hypothetical protein [Paenibacillus anaericanus]
MKSFFANAFAFIYFAALILPMLLVIFIIHLLFLSDVSTIRTSGFSGPSGDFIIVYVALLSACRC